MKEVCVRDDLREESSFWTFRAKGTRKQISQSTEVVYLDIALTFFFFTDWVLTTRRQELTSLAKYQAKFLSPKKQK